MAERGTYVVCMLATRMYALPVAHVIETMRPQPVVPTVGAAAFVLGLAMIRGAPTPVVDLAVLVSGARSPASRRFVTLRVGERVVAVAVDDVVGVRAIEHDAITELPPLLADAAAIEGVAALDRELLVVLATAHVVPESVWALGEAGASTS